MESAGSEVMMARPVKVVNYDTSFELTTVEKLQEYLKIHPMRTPAADDSILFSYSTETPKELVRALYNRFYPDFHAFKSYFPGLFDGGVEGVMKLKCNCVQCLHKPGLAGPRPGTCGRVHMMADLEFLYEAGFPAAEGEVVGIVDSTAHDGLLTFQHSSGEDRYFRLNKSKLRFIQHHSPTQSMRRPTKPKIRLESFAVNLDPGRTPEASAALYIAALLRRVCGSWEQVIECSKKHLSHLKQDLTTTAPIPLSTLRTLRTSTASWDRLCNLHSAQINSLSFLRSYDQNESWFQVSKASSPSPLSSPEPAAPAAPAGFVGFIPDECLDGYLQVCRALDRLALCGGALYGVFKEAGEVEIRAKEMLALEKLELRRGGVLGSIPQPTPQLLILIAILYITLHPALLLAVVAALATYHLPLLHPSTQTQTITTPSSSPPTSPRPPPYNPPPLPDLSLREESYEDKILTAAVAAGEELDEVAKDLSKGFEVVKREGAGNGGAPSISSASVIWPFG